MKFEEVTYLFDVGFLNMGSNNIYICIVLLLSFYMIHPHFFMQDMLSLGWPSGLERWTKCRWCCLDITIA